MQDTATSTQPSISARYAQLPRYYQQTPDGYLDEPPRERAFDSAERFCLRGSAAVDLDNDGDLDIVAVEHRRGLVFFENTSNRPALTIELQDARGGRSPMGARVSFGGRASLGGWASRPPDVADPTARVPRVAPAELRLTLLPNQGYQSSQDTRLFVPRPANGAAASSVTIHWPDGSIDHHGLRDVATARLVFRQGDKKP